MEAALRFMAHNNLHRVQKVRWCKVPIEFIIPYFGRTPPPFDLSGLRPYVAKLHLIKFYINVSNYTVLLEF